MSDRKTGGGGWGGKREGNHKGEDIDYTGGFMGICLSQNLSNCTVKQLLGSGNHFFLLFPQPQT